MWLRSKEFYEYKSLSIDGKLSFIQARAKAKSKEFVKAVEVNPRKLLPIIVAVVVLIIGLGHYCLSKISGLGETKSMEEYVYCGNCREYHKASSCKKSAEPHWELGVNIYEETWCCPSCGCDDLTDANLCLLCEQPTVNRVLCDECLGEFGVYYHEFCDKVIERWHNNVTKSDIADILYEHIGDL